MNDITQLSNDQLMSMSQPSSSTDSSTALSSMTGGIKGISNERLQQLASKSGGIEALSNNELLEMANGKEKRSNSSSDNSKTESQTSTSKEGGWKSFGKGIMSSIVDVPSNYAKSLAAANQFSVTGNPGLDRAAKALTPFGMMGYTDPKYLEGNQSELDSRALEEDNAANQLGRVAGDVGIGVATGMGIGSGAASVGGRVLADATSAGTAGAFTGGPTAGGVGGIGGAVLSGAGRGLGMAPKETYQYNNTTNSWSKTPSPTLLDDVRSVFRDPIMWGAGGAGYAASHYVPGAALGLALYPTYKVARAVAPHIPYANTLLRQGSTIPSAVGGGIASSLFQRKKKQ